MCEKDTDKDLPEIAHDIATAFVSATANVVLECNIVGAGEVHADGYAKAVAKGKAWLSAFASAWAGADVCLQEHPEHAGHNKECSAIADAFLQIQEEVFLKTVAEQKDWISATFDKHNTCAPAQHPRRITSSTISFAIEFIYRHCRVSAATSVCTSHGLQSEVDVPVAEEESVCTGAHTSPGETWLPSRR